LVLAGALWWVYFDSAADINEYALRASGGSPAAAYTLYAGGHLGPAFALILVAAGISVALSGNDAGTASWLLTSGLATYLAGTRVFLAGRRSWWRALGRIAVVAGTVQLAQLHRIMPVSAVVAVVTGWAVVAAAVVSVRGQRIRLRLESPEPAGEAVETPARR
jgi:low temperature requirement protein LtrA